MINQTTIPYSIIVPARNEEETIGEVLRGVRHLTDDLVVVDGHSSDRTVAIANEYGARVIQDNGKGKGDAVRIGLAEAKHPMMVFSGQNGWTFDEACTISERYCRVSQMGLEFPKGYLGGTKRCRAMHPPQPRGMYHAVSDMNPPDCCYM